LLNLTESEARTELSDALQRLLSQQQEARLDELSQKGTLSDSEKAELKGLLSKVNRITQ
jgi:hypothetical protein